MLSFLAFCSDFLAKFALRGRSIMRPHSHGKILLVSKQPPRFEDTYRKVFEPFAVHTASSPLI